MDNNLLVSMISGKQAAPEKSKDKKDQGITDDTFSKMFEKEVGASKTATKSEKEMVGGHEAKPDDKKELHKEDEAYRVRMGIKSPTAMVGSSEYVHRLAMKDVAEVSIADRQAFHLGEFSSARMAAKNFTQALAQRGVNMKDLSFTQLAQLARQKGKEELHSMLDELGLSKKEIASDLLGLTKTSSKPDTTKKGAPGTVKPDSQAEQPTAKAITPAQQAEQAADARKLQREEVIKQIITHIDVQQVANKTEVALKLNPEYLGDLKITLKFEGKNNVDADFETTSKDTKELLEEGMDVLKGAFGSRGMTLGKVQTKLVEHVA